MIVERNSSSFKVQRWSFCGTAAEVEPTAGVGMDGGG